MLVPEVSTATTLKKWVPDASEPPAPVAVTCADCGADKIGLRHAVSFRIVLDEISMSLGIRFAMAGEAPPNMMFSPAASM